MAEEGQLLLIARSREGGECLPGVHVKVKALIAGQNFNCKQITFSFDANGTTFTDMLKITFAVNTNRHLLRLTVLRYICI